jgi:chaperonin GroEL
MIEKTYKIISFGSDARDKVKVGVETLTEAVKVTMGPSGHNVLIEQQGAPPILTKDGVTVARAVNLRDKFANLGVQLVREAAQRTAEEAGDGTTTATVLANALYREGLKAINAGHDLRTIREGMQLATQELCSLVQESAVPIKSDDELLKVANISVNHERELAELIVKAIKAVGDNGTVTVDEAKGFSSSLEVVEGCELDRGYTSPYFVNKPSRMACELQNPAILVTDQRISSVSHIMHFMEESHRENRPFVIISPEVTGDAMQTLIMNTTKNILKSCVLAAPEFGNARLESLRDLCVLLDCDLMSGDPSAWRDKKLSDLGRCKKMTAFRFRTILVGAKGSKKSCEKRSTDIKNAMRTADSDLAQVLSRRLRRLNSGIGILRVGGSTEAEIGERKDRVEDALYATRAAMQEGIVAGGGSLLAKLAKQKLDSSDNLSLGESIVYKAACEPLKQIAENCGSIPDIVLEKVGEKPAGYGYNGIEGTICDLLEAGIVDPARVTRLALQNASSVSINLLSIGCTMVEDLFSQEQERQS